MRKAITILAILLAMVTVTSCNASSGKTGSDSWFYESQSESVQSDSGSRESGGTVVKPITGGGDFNAGNDYKK